MVEECLYIGAVGQVSDCTPSHQAVTASYLDSSHQCALSLVCLSYPTGSLKLLNRSRRCVNGYIAAQDQVLSMRGREDDSRMEDDCILQLMSWRRIVVRTVTRTRIIGDEGRGWGACRGAAR